MVAFLGPLLLYLPSYLQGDAAVPSNETLGNGTAGNASSIDGFDSDQETVCWSDTYAADALTTWGTCGALTAFAVLFSRKSTGQSFTDSISAELEVRSLSSRSRFIRAQMGDYHLIVWAFIFSIPSFAVLLANLFCGPRLGSWYADKPWPIHRPWPLLQTLLLSMVWVTLSLVWIMLSIARYKSIMDRVATIEKDLAHIFEDGTIQLLSIKWLLEQPKGFILSRRQDLPPEAFLKPEEAIQRHRCGQVAALSYRWLESCHPDPSGWHMRALQSFLESSSLPCTALVIDFASLPQHNPSFFEAKAAAIADGVSEDEADRLAKTAFGRTPDEQAVFKAGLDRMSSIYASPRVAVLQHKALPDDGKERRPYESSGWCIFEQAAASLSTRGGGCLFNLELGRVTLTVSQRPSAAEMEALLHDESKTQFYGRADRDIVSEQYRDLLDRVEDFEFASLDLGTVFRAYGDNVCTTGPRRGLRAVLNVIAVLIFAFVFQNGSVNAMFMFGACLLILFVLLPYWTSPLLRVVLLSGGRATLPATPSQPSTDVTIDCRSAVYGLLFFRPVLHVHSSDQDELQPVQAGSKRLEDLVLSSTV